MTVSTATLTREATKKDESGKAVVEHLQQQVANAFILYANYKHITGRRMVRFSVNCISSLISSQLLCCRQRMNSRSVSGSEERPRYLTTGRC